MTCHKIKSGFICFTEPIDDDIDKTPAEGECGKHHYELPESGYTQTLADGVERLKRKEKQFICPVCCLWIWEAWRVR